MYISRHNIGNLYNNILLKEMNQSLIDYLDENSYDSNLPFNHIFGDDLRIYIPMYKDPTAKDILNTLKNIKDFEGVDLEKGEVIRKIKLDARYSNEAEKEQRVNIGSAISKMKLDPNLKKKYLDWLGRYKTNIAEALGKGKYGVIISRAPIDVLRMSDFEELKSCHSQPNKFPTQRGQYFQCAMQEAFNGGGVAFIVDNDELADCLDNGVTLNDTEFFSDEDRGTGENITPLARLRLRRLVNGNGDDFTVTDNKVYGNSSIPGFRKAVDEFIKERQIGIDEFTQYEWKSTGGSYFDTTNDAQDLVDEYFHDSNTRSPYIYHTRDDSRSEDRMENEVKRLAVNMQEECQRITNEYNEDYNAFEVGADVNRIDSYINPFADFSLSMKIWGIPELMTIEILLEDEGEVTDAINEEYDTEEIYWSTVINWVSEMVSKEFGCSLHSFEIKNGVISFALSISETLYDIEEYENFCNYISKIDKNMWEFSDWEEILGDSGAMPRLSQNPLKTLMKLGTTSNHLTVKLSVPKSVEFRVLLDAVLGSYTQYSGPDSRVNNDTIADYREIGNTFGGMLSKYVKMYYDPEKKNGIETFAETYHRLTSHGIEIFNQYYIDKVEIAFAPYDFNTNSTILLDVRFIVPNFNYINCNLLLFLNNNLDDLKNMATLAYLAENRYIHPGSSRYKNQFNALKRVYGKFL